MRHFDEASESTRRGSRSAPMQRAVWLLSLVPGVLAGQTGGPAACVPSIGWNVKDCASCMITSDEEVQYLVEPRLHGVDTTTAGPARGMLHEGDVLVAVNDQLITTKPAWQSIDDARRRGAQLTLTVQRGNAPVTVQVVPRAACASATKPAPDQMWAGGPQVEWVTPSIANLTWTVEETHPFDWLTGHRVSVSPTALTLRNPTTWHSAPDTANQAAGFVVDTLASASRRPPIAANLPSGPGTRLRLGLGVECDQCSGVSSLGDSTPVYRFAEPPVVDYVAPDSPAAHAGIQLGDTITAVNNVPITSDRGGRLFSLVAPSEQITLRVLHGTDTRTVTLTAAPATTTQEFYVGGVRISIDGGFKRMDFDAKTQELTFTFADGHVVRIKTIPK